MRMLIRPIRSVGVLSAALLVLTGCGDGQHEDVKQWMADASRDLRGGVPPLPELQIPPIVSYASQDSRDPFSSARIEPERTDTGGKTPNFDRPREPLEAYPLASVSFRGLVTKASDGRPHGLVWVDGVMYPVVVGNYVGENFGRIVAIDNNEIQLIETLQDPTGQSRDWVERTATLVLQEGETGKETQK